MRLHRVRRLALLLLIASAPRAAVSADTSPPPEGVAACQACHGPAGLSSTPGIPHLAGQRRDYLVKQLKNFRAGDRKNDLMSAIASQLSDERIEALATYWSSLAGAVPGHAGTVPAPALPSRMGFPAGFLKTFVRYTVEENPQSSQVVERYANRLAVDAARAGKPLPEGAVLMSVTRSAARDAQGRLVPGDPVSYAGMEARAGWGEAIPELLRNGNWDYALFNREGRRNDSLNQAACLACHRPIAASSHVFTLKALAASAPP
jgi:cytochrome c553